MQEGLRGALKWGDGAREGADTVSFVVALQHS